MKFTKRLITRAYCFIIIMAMILSLSSSLIVTAIDTIEDLIADAVAIPGKQELLALEEVTTDVFGEREINTCGYLYNLDDSADYIYVAFTTGEYAIFAKQTMEMLEYNLAGTLPYDTTAQKYYVGPNNYLQKSNNTFYHALTGTELQITAAEAQAVAQQTRAAITNT